MEERQDGGKEGGGGEGDSDQSLWGLSPHPFLLHRGSLWAPSFVCCGVATLRVGGRPCGADVLERKALLSHALQLCSVFVILDASKHEFVCEWGWGRLM